MGRIQESPTFHRPHSSHSLTRFTCSELYAQSAFHLPASSLKRCKSWRLCKNFHFSGGPAAVHQHLRQDGCRRRRRFKAVCLIDTVFCSTRLTDKCAASLLDTGEYSDFTISTPDKDLKVHRNILCVKSAYFRTACAGEFQVRLFLLATRVL